MARKPNFGFEKRQKDIKKQQKRDEKAEKKRLRALEGGPSEDQADGSPDEDDQAEPGMPGTGTETP